MTFTKLDALCECHTAPQHRAAVDEVLAMAKELRSDRESLLATIHLAINQRAWDLQIAKEEGGADEDMIESWAGEVADLLALLKIVLAYPSDPEGPPED